MRTAPIVSRDERGTAAYDALEGSGYPAGSAWGRDGVDQRERCPVNFSMHPLGCGGIQVGIVGNGFEEFKPRRLVPLKPLFCAWRNERR